MDDLYWRIARLRKRLDEEGIEYYGGGTPYEGNVLDNRVRFDIFNDAVYAPYPDLITDLRLMKPCDTDK